MSLAVPAAMAFQAEIGSLRWCVSLCRGNRRPRRHSKGRPVVTPLVRGNTRIRLSPASGHGLFPRVRGNQAGVRLAGLAVSSRWCRGAGIPSRSHKKYALPYVSLTTAGRKTLNFRWRPGSRFGGAFGVVRPPSALQGHSGCPVIIGSRAGWNMGTGMGLKRRGKVMLFSVDRCGQYGRCSQPDAGYRWAAAERRRQAWQMRRGGM